MVLSSSGPSPLPVWTRAAVTAPFWEPSLQAAPVVLTRTGWKAHRPQRCVTEHGDIAVLTTSEFYDNV